jgi:imidazole glycerol-phosphate synthase subunit HisH
MISQYVMIDYGVGNVFSLLHALKRVGIECTLTSDPFMIQQAKVILLPGVGAFEDAMNQIKQRNLDQILKQVRKDQWLVGICLGMQLLYEVSEEFGVHEGLGLLKGRIIKFESKTLKIPHMGWNKLSSHHTNHALLKDLDHQAYVYYVHSYYASECESTTLVATSDYGVDVPGIVMKDNIIGFQFHPEKSGVVGEQLLRNLKEVCR